jgi:putative hemolysin
MTHKAVVALLPGAGRYRARLAESAADVAATQALRHLCFVEAAGWPARPGGLEADGFDARCRHVMIEETPSGRLVCSFRIMDLAAGAEIGRSYAAQFYDLGRLADYALPMVEVGRFCMHPEARDADVLRLAWGALARIVDGQGVGMLFGCSSFAGTDPAPYAGAFALLAQAHVAPAAVAPGVKATEVVRFGAGAPVDRLRALAAMPPLLRTYLGMGGWVSDHAVIDRDLGTLHVFTGVEIGAIPPGRARALRAVAG